MKSKHVFFFYLLGAYVILQFAWWAWHIIQLTRELGIPEATVSKRVGMIVGEGLVFFLILIFGLWRLIRSIKREHKVAAQQHNFLLSVTHELKTPLAANKLYLQTLLKHKLSVEKADDLLQKALVENERLDELVEAILISARIENRSVQLHKEEIDLSELLSHLQHKYRQRLNQDWIEVEWSGSPKIMADRFILKTILVNLIENALKYAGTKDKLQIKVKAHSDQIEIMVADQGPGIPNEYQQQVFEKFFRPGNEETRSKKGTGLGLFIVKEFVKLCNGSIRYKQNVPHGALFEIRL